MPPPSRTAAAAAVQTTNTLNKFKLLQFFIFVMREKKMFSLRVYDGEKKSNTKVCEFKEVAEGWFSAALPPSPQSSGLCMYIVEPEKENRTCDLFVLFLVNRGQKKVRQCSKVLSCSTPVLPRFWLEPPSIDSAAEIFIHTPRNGVCVPSVHSDEKLETKLCLLLNF